MSKFTHNIGVNGQIRIIGGKWRGRKLLVPYSNGLRPTINQVRETLFNWLTPYIQRAHCLDCFAGSGALGLEALSRHAASATMLELERLVAKQIIQNLQTLDSAQGKLDSAQGKVVQTNSLQWLRQSGEPFDVIFVDPPFRKGLLEETCMLLEHKGWLADKAFIYIESEVENNLPITPTNWYLYREKIAGQIAYRLYQRQHETHDTT